MGSARWGGGYGIRVMGWVYPGVQFGSSFGGAFIGSPIAILMWANYRIKTGEIVSHSVDVLSSKRGGSGGG